MIGHNVGLADEVHLVVRVRVYVSTETSQTMHVFAPFSIDLLQSAKNFRRPCVKIVL